VSSAVRARLLVGAACTDWQLDALRDDAMIVSSELVANAVLHARTECRLTVELDARGLTIAVPHHWRGWISGGRRSTRRTYGAWDSSWSTG
jgi:hypothetical protein